MIKKIVQFIHVFEVDFVRYWGSDVSIITEETGENSLKDEDNTNNMNISKNTKLLLTLLVFSSLIWLTFFIVT